MTDAPERIFAGYHHVHGHQKVWDTKLIGENGWQNVTEYIRADKVAALVEALEDVASESLSDEIPEGYGPDLTENPDFNRGYDAALHRVRRALAAFKGDAQ